MTERIYMSSPDVGPLEEEYIIRAFRSGWIAPLGPDVDAFESEIAERAGRTHAVALSSGTAALHLALIVHGIGEGDIVVTSTLTFAATVNAIRYVGAVPYFVDVEESSGNIDPALLDEVLTALEAAGTPAAAVMPVDLLGKAADYSRILPVTERHEVLVITDAAESFGASHAGRPAASFGSTSAISFNGNKIMTTSGGGMLVTDDADIATRTRYLATQARQPVAHYEHTEVGYNYRLSNLLAALGRAQLTRLDEMIARRREVRELYAALFAPVDGVTIFGSAGDAADNYWLTAVVIDSDVTGWTPDDLSSWLAVDSIESRPLWKPMHAQPAFAQFPSLETGVADGLFTRGLTLPSGSALTPTQRETVIARISAFLRERT